MKLPEIREFFIQYVSFLLYFLILFRSFHTITFYFPESTLQSPLIPRPPPPPSLLSFRAPTPPTPACVWAGGMDKNVGQETQSLLDITASYSFLPVSSSYTSSCTRHSPSSKFSGSFLPEITVQYAMSVVDVTSQI